MRESVEKTRRIAHPFSEVCAVVITYAALCLFGVGIYGFWMMHESNNPIYAALLDGSLLGVGALFCFSLILLVTESSQKEDG